MTIASGTTERSPHTLMRASAGSGKTFELTNRMLALMLDPREDIAGALATTFTRAAAGEILHRALSRLSAAVIESDALAELQAHVATSTTREQCARSLERVVAQLHRVNVLTIDAFFSRLASAFSLELGLAPGWRMLDEAEDASLRALAVDRAVREEEASAMVALLRDLQGEHIQTHAHQAIMQIVNEAYSAFLETEGDLSAWEAVQPIDVPLADEALDAAIETLAKQDRPLTKAGTPDKRWSDAIDAAVTAATAGQWSAFAACNLSARILAGDLKYNRRDIAAPTIEAFSPLLKHARAVLTREHAQRTAATLAMLRRFHAAYVAMKRSIGGMTFDDPPRLLAHAARTGDLDHLYFRLDARIRHVLLDEFQDTSMAQFRLLEPLLDELLSQATDERSVFCVGDAKQSLYAWRNAEPMLLPSMPSRWATFHEATLAKSYRSSPIVLDAVNAIFSGIQRQPAMQDGGGAERAAEAWDAGFDVHESAKSELPGAVRLAVAGESGAHEVGAARRLVMQAAAARVVDAQAHAPSASIAVLVRSGADIATVLRLLKAEGVDASEQRGNPLIDTPAVAAAMSLLRFVDHPGHTAALFHVATTPLGAAVGLTDARDAHAGEAIAATLRQRIAERGLATVLAAWHEVCIGEMDARSSSRFEQLIDLAATWDTSARGGGADFADFIEERRVDEPGRAPVRVMTIHGSKGLEFDVVVLPLFEQLGWRPTPRGVLVSRDNPLGPVTAVSRYPNTTMRLLDDTLRSMHDHAMQRQVNEELCCLYVATTRAKRCLEMIVPPDTPGIASQSRGDPRNPWRLKPEHVVRWALASDEPASPGATLWEHTGDRDWASGLADNVRDDVADGLRHVSLTVRAPVTRNATRLAGATPSRERAGRAVDAAALLKRRDARGRIIGDLVHRWFERIEWLEHGAPAGDDLRAEAASGGVNADLVDRAVAAYTDGIDGEGIRTALSRDRWLSDRPDVDDVTVRAERPFAVRDGDRLLEGRFDRLVVGLRTGVPICAEVVDFKTDQAARWLAGAALREYAESHRPQMEAYQRAAASVLGLDLTAVAMTLAFTAAGACISLAPVR